MGQADNHSANGVSTLRRRGDATSGIAVSAWAATPAKGSVLGKYLPSACRN